MYVCTCKSEFVSVSESVCVCESVDVLVRGQIFVGECGCMYMSERESMSVCKSVRVCVCVRIHPLISCLLSPVCVAVYVCNMPYISKTVRVCVCAVFI